MASEEAVFQEKVVELAMRTGWLIHHDRRQDLSIGGDPGFPDLVLARGGRVIFAELKNETRKPTAAQVSWLSQLTGRAWTASAGDQRPLASVALWRPSQLTEIASLLSRRQT